MSFNTNPKSAPRMSVLHYVLGIVAIACSLAPANRASAKSPPNVLFLAVDDMKDWVNCLGGYEGTVHTPHIDRLAKRGMLFTNAHCASPKCAPSRAAIMTGLRPSTTGLYENNHWWLPNFPDVVTIPAHFREHGYQAAGAGKIFHHTAGNNPPNQWDDFHPITFRNDPWFRGSKSGYPWSKSGPRPRGYPFSGVDGLPEENDWGTLGISEKEYDDSLSADYAVQFLTARKGRQGSPPFFLACGIYRPHLPWYAPQSYFDLYPIEEIVLPKTRDDDLDDIPTDGVEFARARSSDFEKIKKSGKWRHAVQAYLASISFADAQIGRVLTALDESGHANDTITVFWSDHGWHLGEKQHWHKSTLWEEATRVPFIISVPGYKPGICARAVSLIDIFPTLNDLCGLPDIDAHDGLSLDSLLRDPDAESGRPAIVEFRLGNVAVRSDRYRYIRYHDGGEEFYDHKSDPYEWENVVSNPDYANAKAKLVKWTTTTWAPSAPTKDAYEFDPDTFIWKERATGRLIRGRAEK